METSTTKATNSDTSTREPNRSKRRKSDKSTEVEDGLVAVKLDEAGVARLLTEKETLTREIKEGQRAGRFILKQLPDDESWKQTRHELLEVCKHTPDTKFKVVVLGPSGVGKSSVLNALLDEGNLLPSSATGDACTAVPIEIHYNNDASCIDVKAEIQYVTEVEWRRVIEEAKAEAETDEDDHTDRGQSALKRVNLVYPSLQKDELIEDSVNDIIAMNVSKELLGKCTTLQASDRIDFCRDFKQQIGSIKRPGFATWPMIDHVRLYVRHPLLEHGLVLVDIPGMFETNQARVENAAKYLQKCSAVLIMTHAARSNSDATQADLASRALRQVQFDQRLDRVMYVCTKSEELNLEEVMDELDVPGTELLRSQLKTAKQDEQKIEHEGDTLELELKEQEKIVKYSASDVGRWGRARTKAAGDWESFVVPGVRRSNGTCPKVGITGEDWDEDDVIEKIRSLKQEEAAAKRRSKTLKAQLTANKSRCRDNESQIKELELQMKRAVFRARNELVKENQVRRYISAVKSFEQESAKVVEGIVDSAEYQSTRSTSFSSVKEKVFCVSAMAYSRIAGLIRYAIKEGTEAVKQDGKDADFLDDVQDTEIPALARRLKHLTLSEKSHNLRKIQLRMQIAFGSLQSRLLPTIQHKEIDVDAALEATQDFADVVSQFLKGFGEFSFTDTAVKDVYKVQFTGKMPLIEAAATKQIIKKLKVHAKHPSRDTSSKALWPGEFKAAVHPSRNGFYETKRLFSNGQKLCVNFNATAALTIKDSTHQLIQTVLVSGDIKQALTDLQRQLETVMDKLHSEFRLKAMTVGVDLRRVNFVDDKLQLRKRDLKQTFVDALEGIKQAHVSAAGHLNKDIQNAWKPAYARAYLESGAGARVAMSDELVESLVNDKVVKGALNKMDRRINARLDKILATLASALTTMAKRIVAEYTDHMEHRNRKIETTGDPKMDMVRNRLIALGYDDLEEPVADAEEDVPVDVGARATELDEVMAELAGGVDEIDGTTVKVEAESEEIGDETEDGESREETEAGKIKDEASDHEMTDEETDEETS